MTELQRKKIDTFIEKHGEVTVVEAHNGLQVQLRIGHKVAKNVGISLHWLTDFEECFENISIGVPYNENPNCALYVSLFYKEG